MSYPVPYNGNLTWLAERTILLVRHGSHAFGTNIATSDEDYKGIAIPPREYFYGFQNVFEQAEGHDPDLVVYDIRKFMRLAADCNPSIIEVLFVDDADVLLCTPAGRILREHRRRFLSMKAKHTYSGYAVSQLKRIRTHYRWLTRPPAAPPTRAELGLPEATVIPADQLAAAQSAIAKKLEEWNLDGLDGLDPAARILVQAKMAESLAEMRLSADEAWRCAARTIGVDENFIRLLDLERICLTTTLRAMEREGTLESYERDAGLPERGGRPRRFYRLSASEREKLVEIADLAARACALRHPLVLDELLSDASDKEIDSLLRGLARDGEMQRADSSVTATLDEEIQQIYAALRVRLTGKAPLRPIWTTDESRIHDVLPIEDMKVTAEGRAAVAHVAEQLGIELDAGDSWIDAALRLREKNFACDFPPAVHWRIGGAPAKTKVRS